MWKVMLDSSRGTSHNRDDTPCQDACASMELITQGHPALALVCSDGAGSAKFSDLGAQFVCSELLQFVGDHFESGGLISEVDHDRVLQWLKSCRTSLSLCAGHYEQPINEFACTALFALVDDTCAVFAQVGDGAIVVGSESNYDVIFWPDHGEFLNTTTFVTSENLPEAVQHHFYPYPVHDIALMTDGLQMLALDFKLKSAHNPFFTNLFSRLHGDEDVENLNQLLRDFLNSPAVNARTDDDKTLLLATKQQCVPRPDILTPQEVPLT